MLIEVKKKIYIYIYTWLLFYLKIVKIYGNSFSFMIVEGNGIKMG